MPQLNFAYYISQITWLFITFACFFCISKFLILPQLNRIIKARNDFVDTNIKFAQNIVEKAKKINETCDKDIENNNNKINEKILLIVNDLKKLNSNKIDNLKKKMNEKENESILQMKQDLQLNNGKLNSEIITLICDILEKTYFIKPKKEIIEKIYNKYV